MKTTLFQKALAMAGTLGLLALHSSAQESMPAAESPSAQVSASTPATGHLPYGASQILQLQQAQVGDETIVSYIKNSGNGYQLDANQIIYLKQQGVSTTVIAEMLNQPKAGVAPAKVTAPPAAQPAADVAPPATYAASLRAQPVGSVTILPTIHAAEPPSYYFPPRTGISYVPAAPIFYPGGCYYGTCAPLGCASTRFYRGCAVGSLNGRISRHY